MRGAAAIERSKIDAPEYEDLRDLLRERAHSKTTIVPVTPAEVLEVVRVGRGVLAALNHLAASS